MSRCWMKPCHSLDCAEFGPKECTAMHHLDPDFRCICDDCDERPDECGKEREECETDALAAWADAAIDAHKEDGR